MRWSQTRPRQWPARPWRRSTFDGATLDARDEVADVAGRVRTRHDAIVFFVFLPSPLVASELSTARAWSLEWKGGVAADDQTGLMVSVVARGPATPGQHVRRFSAVPRIRPFQCSLALLGCPQHVGGAEDRPDRALLAGSRVDARPSTARGGHAGRGCVGGSGLGAANPNRRGRVSCL